MANLSFKVVQSGSARPLLYVGIAVAIATWSTAVLWFAINIVPLDVYWMSYYAVDYTVGFVRRGLAGELAGLIPGHYFAAALGLRWLSTAIYLCALGLVAGVVLFGRRRSARRLMVAMLIPLLPFGIPFAAYSARPDLFGAAALAVFAVALPFARSRTVALAWCTYYGLAIAALTLVHEAIGLQFALGAVLAIVVLGNTLGTARRRGVLLAVAPGVLTAFCGGTASHHAQSIGHHHVAAHARAVRVRCTAKPNRLSRLGVPQRDADLRLRGRGCHAHCREHRGGRPRRLVGVRCGGVRCNDVRNQRSVGCSATRVRRPAAGQLGVGGRRAGVDHSGLPDRLRLDSVADHRDLRRCDRVYGVRGAQARD